ncbi:MAG: chitobiase/beta-hexosaminidase C-terminal domain-containing protein [Odoribacter sp.]|nr:chitobiase/beta-hexosaminidase C-terminal domain-containing protein [Odoribacter sp.]
MKRFLTTLAILASLATANAEINSFTISFGSDHSSTQSLDNSDFTDAVSKGRGYIAEVTSVVNVFPEVGSVKLSSSKTNGKFNIHLASGACIIPEYYEIVAARYNNNRDAQASIMLNSETVYIPDTEFTSYRIDVPAIQPQKITNLILDADKRVYLQSITVYYDTANGTVEPEKETVATPQFTPAGGNITKGSVVAISCSTPDAEIHYTTDGSDPSPLTLRYTEPIVINSATVIRAIACKEGMSDSFVAEASFTVSDSQAEQQAFFNFNEPGTLHPAIEEPGRSEWIDLNNRSFTDMDAAVTFTASDAGNTHVRLYHSYDAGCDVRIYDGETITISSMNPSMHLVRIEFEASESGTSNIELEPSAGEFDLWDYTWNAPDDETIDSVVLTSFQQSRIKTMTVYMSHNSGIAGIDYDRDEPATYYNINGVRVGAAVPSPGFYIKVTAGGAKKIIVK